MRVDITYMIKRAELKVELYKVGYPKEIITMPAYSGGWDDHKALPAGEWYITENPSGIRSYFGLFYKDENINDQFLHDGKWRDGIRFGFHGTNASHGCIMTTAKFGGSIIDAEKKMESNPRSN